MRRLKLFIVLGFAIMFVAGLEVGRSHTTPASLRDDWSQLVQYVHGSPAQNPSPPILPTKSQDYWLFGNIKLTKAQHEQIQKIFAEARADTDAKSRQITVFDRLNEDVLLSMLDPEQKLQYEQIQQERAGKIASIRAEISARMKKAGDDVRVQLNPDQQKLFDEERKNPDRNRRGNRGNPSRGGRQRGGPETAPAHDNDSTTPASK